MNKLYCALATASVLCCSGCTAGTEILKLRRDQLLREERNASVVASYAAADYFQPGRYDVYLFLNASVLNGVLSQADNTRIQIDVSGRPVAFTLDRVRFQFRPGSSNVEVGATATDLKSGLRAAVSLDSYVELEADPQRPGVLLLRIKATRVVPDLSYGPFDLQKWRFARDLIALNALRLTEKIPAIEVPLNQAFALGGPQSSTSVSIPTGEGYIVGSVKSPSTKLTGNVSVKQILFLRNGLHIFANVEGL